MHIKQGKKTFLFVNHSTSLTSSLTEALLYIEDCIGDLLYQNNLYTKVKAVLTEMLTNGIKHACTDKLNMDITVATDKIVITKTDNGKRFVPTVIAQHDQKDCIVCYGTHYLYTTEETDNTLRFIAVDMEEAPEPLALAEHFGLLIITKSSEIFTYNYNTDSLKNTFTAHISFK